MPKGIYKHPPQCGFQKGYKQNPATRVLWNKGKKATAEHRRKNSEGVKAHYDKVGRKQYKRYIHQCSSLEYKKWRSGVFERDNWICQTCGARSKTGEPVYLEAHHIKGWAKYPKLRYVVSNGITLCEECHKLTRKTK